MDLRALLLLDVCSACYLFLRRPPCSNRVPAVSYSHRGRGRPFVESSRIANKRRAKLVKRTPLLFILPLFAPLLILVNMVILDKNSIKFIKSWSDGDFRLRPEFPDPNSNLPQLAYQQILDEDRNIVLEELVGEYEFHEEHNHWHINNVALFEVHAGSPDGPVYGSGTIKVTFCLIDW